MGNAIKVIDKNCFSEKLAVVVGTRPGIVMFAPIIQELDRTGTPYFNSHGPALFAEYGCDFF